MRDVSAEFLSALTGSISMVTSVRLLTGFQTGVNPGGYELDVTAGNVRANANADNRATCVLGVATASLTPDVRALLEPWGAEVFVRRGLRFGDGSTEWVGLGYFRVDRVGDSYLAPLTVNGSDRMSGIRDARLLQPRQFVVGTLVGDVFDDLVHEVYPLAEIEWDDATNLLGLTRSLTIERDRYAGLRDLATAYGKVAYWNYRGALRVETPPDPTVPLWTVADGTGGVLIDYSLVKTREGVYNAVVVSGEGSDTIAPVWVAVLDTNANSPTYYHGSFGKVPYFFNSPLVTDYDQAVAAATTILKRVIGRPSSIDFASVPNVALEPLDPVRIPTTEGYQVHVLDEVTYPLAAKDAMTCSTRNTIDVGEGSVLGE